MLRSVTNRCVSVRVTFPPEFRWRPPFPNFQHDRVPRPTDLVGYRGDGFATGLRPRRPLSFCTTRGWGFLTRHQTSPEVLRALEQIARDSGPGSNSEGDRTNLESESDRAAWVTRIHALIDADAKQTGLKWLQGLIWDEGYRSGELKSVIFSDAVESIRAWHRSGLQLRIYSSGSIAAQRLFFAYSDSGDWTGCLEDTTTRRLVRNARWPAIKPLSQEQGCRPTRFCSSAISPRN